MKKTILLTMILLMGTVTLADDWYTNPSSPTNVMMNPMNAWHPANIYHNTVLNPYKYYEEEDSYDRATRIKTKKYNSCVKYGGGDACRSILNN
jgi:hypothetical protein